MDIKVRKKILIVDDEEMNRELLRRIFENTYEIVMARNGKEAIEMVKRFQSDIAIILLDLIMPVMNGYQALQIMYADRVMEKIPVILISTNTDIRITLSCYALGAIDVISKPFIPDIVRRRVDNVIKIYQREEILEMQLMQTQERILEKEREIEAFYDEFLESVSNIIEFRNAETGNHIKRVKNLTRIMATTYRNMFPENRLTQEDVDLISKFSVLHDIGKLAIPDSILLKPGKLTEEEHEIMRSHTTKGCDILEEMDSVKNSDHLKIAYDIVRSHHERYDGSGYPDGLVGEAIPLSAQLVSIMDVYDNLVNERVYKRAYGAQESYDMITKGECGEFSPKIFACFEQARKAIEYFSDTN